MENNIKEAVNNEEVIVAAEEVVSAASSNGLKILAGTGLVVVAGVVTYKYVAKPVIAKIKAKKQAKILDMSKENYCECEDCQEEI